MSSVSMDSSGAQDLAGGSGHLSPCPPGHVQQQQYCLRWNNHQHNLLSVFADLFRSEALVDVTLACAEGMQLKAHKMVLSACSPYFQALLFNTADRHPIVVLRDVRYHEMKALLDFMYRGEVSVDQEHLTVLLKVAEGLKIKGLAEVSDSHQQQAPPLQAAGLTATSLPHLPSPPNSGVAAAAVAHAAATASSSLGPKRKRARPRRLSGSEAVPMAPGLQQQQQQQQHEHGVAGAGIQSRSESLSSKASSSAEIKTEEREMSMEGTHQQDQNPGQNSAAPDTKLERGPRGARERSPSRESAKPLDLMSEADSNEGRTSGLLSPKKPLSWHSPTPMNERPNSAQSEPTPSPSSSSPAAAASQPASTASSQQTPSSSLLLRVAPGPSPTGNNTDHDPQLKRRRESGERDEEEENAGPNQSLDLRVNTNTNTNTNTNANNSGRGRRGRFRGRSLFRGRNHLGRNGGGRGASGSGNSSETKSFSEMSVRGLDLLRYATIAPDGSYRCVECERDHLQRNFKNKYSFQRHAFLYHEGCERKVFPCQVCHKEFSRPDKMKSHLKTAHDYVLPKPDSSGNAASAATATSATSNNASPRGRPAKAGNSNSSSGSSSSVATSAAAAAAAAAAVTTSSPNAVAAAAAAAAAGLSPLQHQAMQAAAAASLAAMHGHVHPLFNLTDAAAVAARDAAVVAAAAEQLSPPQTRVRQRSSH